jgi:D-glycero-D-manno-heptose 1,7-bisphosphate phosphatase
MKRAAVFFDRDNTLIVNNGYLGDPKGVVLVPGAAEAVARAREMGLAVVVFSNQSGVARGMFPEEAVHAVNQRLDEMLHDEDARAVIDRHDFCPFHPQASVERYRQDSDLRKPKPGMIFQAERQLALDLGRSWVVGDAPRDIDAGRAAGCRTILVTHSGLAASPASWEEGKAKPDFEVTSLTEAMEVIERHMNPGAGSTPAAAPATASGTAPAPETNDESPADDAGQAPVTPTAPADTAPREAEPVIAARAGRVRAEAASPPREAAVRAAGGSDVEEEPQPRGAAPRVADLENPLREAPSAAAAGSTLRPKARAEALLEQILDETRRRHEQHADVDFSVSKMMAGIVQIVALAALFLAAIYRDGTEAAQLWLLVAIFLQTLTIALLIMGRQR